MELHQAVRRNDLAALRDVLTRCVEPVDARDGLGRTALSVASEQGDADSVALLAEAGADVNLADLSGFTPLMAAARNQNAVVVEQLLKHGADPTLTDAGGRTARWHSTRRIVQFAIPFLRGTHATLFMPRLYRSKATRLIDAAVTARAKNAAGKRV